MTTRDHDAQANEHSTWEPALLSVVLASPRCRDIVARPQVS